MITDDLINTHFDTFAVRGRKPSEGPMNRHGLQS